MSSESFLAAARAGNVALVRRYLEALTYVDVKDALLNTALHSAARNAHLGVVMLLLERGADVGQRNIVKLTPLGAALHSACFNPSVAEALFAKGTSADLLVLRDLCARLSGLQTLDADLLPAIAFLLDKKVRRSMLLVELMHGHM